MAASNSRAKIGLGAKVVFTQSGWSGEVCETITGLGVERGSINVTHMGVPTLEEVTTNEETLPAGIARIKPMTLVFHFDPAVGLPPINGPVETVEISFKRRATELTPAKFIASGYFTDATLSIPIAEKMVINSVVSFTGNLVYQKPSLL